MFLPELIRPHVSLHLSDLLLVCMRRFKQLHLQQMYLKVGVGVGVIHGKGKLERRNLTAITARYS